MVDKLRAIPEKVSFVIGLTLILFSPILLFFLSILFPLSIWTKIIIEAILCFFAIIFILSASDKRNLTIDKTK
jgi:hypothetical protein